MLKIQRASAGSGKTYTLTESYIINLLAYKTDTGEWKLKNQRQIEDAMKRILAITFTNKATNEMALRIINSLASLSQVNNKSDLNQIPYLQHIRQLTEADVNEIAYVAGIALNTILNNYSLFKISTIDSFFQEILRTFTFEANLNDSYQLEIDSTYVNDEALDNVIRNLDTKAPSIGNSAFWMREIMKENALKSSKWNLFNKKATEGSVYNKIRKALSQIEKEEFKDIKEILDNYFQDHAKAISLINYYKSFREKAILERENLLRDIKKRINNLEADILKNNNSDQLNSYFLRHLGKASSLKINDKIDFKYDSILRDKSVFKKKFRVDGNAFDQEALSFYELLTEWDNPGPSSYYKNWRIYGSMIPYLGLLMEVRQYLTKVLNNNNIIQLHDTSYLLKKIIGEEDAPFIFERLGTQIENYLIDEFQDTSSMQWDVIYPLLKEGVSNKKDSLIIGDPKQSIYRFRNANHTLITKEVPEAFPEHIQAGFSKEDNTNWRSHTKIVKFNNYFFKMLSILVAAQSSKNGGNPESFLNLYSNVVQYPANQKNKGYVEVRIIEKLQDNLEDDSSVDTDNENQKDWFTSAALKNIGPLISSLIDRGYKKKDIAVLVSKNFYGKEVVNELIDYNDTLPPGSPKIDFISEESLLISSSPAVSLILNVFARISQPTAVKPVIDDDKKVEPSKIKYTDWNKIKIDYNIFSQRHKDLLPAEKIMKFLDEAVNENSIAQLLEELPTPSLTSITEMIVKTFMDEPMRKSEALYISSFQDLINEYCSKYSNDPASFLEWWYAKGDKLSVSSPEGLDAVQIMTIHKSKGLEFKCVIVPFATESYRPSNRNEEWRWVIPYRFPDLENPPVLPVKTTQELKGSIHEDIYREYTDQILTDRINMYYVAFTRARNELYVFTKKGTKNLSAFHDFLESVLTDNISFDTIINPDESDDMMKVSELDKAKEGMVISYGQPFTTEEIIDEYSKNADITKIKLHTFKDYFVNNRRPRLRSLASKVTPSGELSDLQDS